MMTEHPPQSTSWGSLLAGMLFGAAAGAVAALLYAPKSGKETRDELNTRLHELRDRCDTLAHQMAEQAQQKFTQAQADLAKGVEAFKQGYTERAAELRQESGLNE